MTRAVLERGSLSEWRRALFEPASLLPSAVDAWASRHPMDEPFVDAEITPAIACCLADLPQALSLVLASGASPDRPDSAGWSPLHWCAQSSLPECAKILLKFGADPDSANDLEGCGPLHLTATSGCLATAKLLALAGADLGRREPATRATAAHWAAHDPAWIQAVGAGVPGVDGFGRGSLHWAVKQAADEPRAMAACRHWLAQGVPAGTADFDGATPAHSASQLGYHECAMLLASSAEREALSSDIAAKSSRPSDDPALRL